MKVIKGIFFTVMLLIMAGCVGVFVCALNPSVTQMLAEKVEGITQSGSRENASPDQEGDGRTEGGWPANSGDSWQDSSQLSGDGTGSSPADTTQVADVRPGINTDWVEGQDRTGYEIPNGQPDQVPESVSGRNGYESVQEEAEQVAEDEAGDLTVGAAGSNLDFDGAFYPYYAMLEDDMQQLYRQIYANAMECTVSFAPVVPVSAQRLKTVFEAVYNDHPELFWLQTGYACKYVPGGNCVEINLKYNAAADNLEVSKQEFETAAERILTGARALGSDYEKERLIHDALMLAAEYDLGAEMNQSAYSALVSGRSVCAGYARAFQYLMQELGVPCYYCTGYAGEDHAWNIVKLGDTYYNVDVTWDDTDTPTYDYFNKSDREFGATHIRTGLAVYLPACLEEGAGESGNAGLAGSADSVPGEAAGGGSAGMAGGIYISDVSDYINPNPIEPLRWQSKSHVGDADPAVEEPGMTAEEMEQANLLQAGLTEEQVRRTLEAYYEDCGKLLKEVGTGDRQFVNVVPEALWSSVERAYSTGDYWKGYVEDALKELGVKNFLIQIQVQHLGGGYYRLYHNVYTY